MNYQEIELLRRKSKDNNWIICLFGAGFLGKTFAYRLIKTAGFEIDCYCDNNKKLYGSYINEIPVISTNELRAKRDNILIFISVSNKFEPEIRDQLREYGIENERIVEANYLLMQEIIESVSAFENGAVLSRWDEFIDDKKYLKWLFSDRFQYEPNLIKPKTFNEKMQWLKLYDRNPLYSKMVDKYSAKRIVKEQIPQVEIAQTIGVWDNFDDIDFSMLPERFVMKCTHDSGSVIVVSDKNNCDYKEIKAKMDKAILRNHYYRFREWPYKDVPHKIIIEEFIENSDYETLPVYKFFCFSGNPMLVQAILNDKKQDEQIDYYDTDWHRLDLRQVFPNTVNGMKKPKSFNKMMEYSRILSKGIPFLRVDFYEADGNAVFSEFTFYPDAGLSKFEPSYWDEKLGDLVELPISI